MWVVCIISISHVVKLNGYGGLQAKVNGKRLRFKGWETLVIQVCFGEGSFRLLVSWHVFLQFGQQLLVAFVLSTHHIGQEMQ